MMLSLRKANIKDAEFLFELRNNPDIFKYYRNPVKVVWNEHISWLKSVVLGETNKDLYIIELDGKRAGQIRFDTEGDKKELSISLQKDFQGQGLGSKSLKKAIEMEKSVILIAEIHKENIASIKLFEKFNFKLQKNKGNFNIYERI